LIVNVTTLSVGKKEQIMSGKKKRKGKVKQIRSGTPKAITRLRLMLGRELAELQKDKTIINRNPIELMLSIKFTDGHVHHIFPDDKVVDEMIMDLLTESEFDLDKLNIIPTDGLDELEEELGEEKEEVVVSEVVVGNVDESETEEDEEDEEGETGDDDSKMAETLEGLGLDS
jgi:hypothetical protein